MSIQSLLSASQSITRMQTMQSARTQMQGTANVLRIESKMDGGNKKKDVTATALEEKFNDLTGDLMDEVNDLNEALKPDEDAKAEEAKEEEAAQKPPKTDTLELSDAASKQIGKGTYAKPAALEAVTYQADGSAKSSAPAKSVLTVEVTA